MRLLGLRILQFTLDSLLVVFASRTVASLSSGISQWLDILDASSCRSGVLSAVGEGDRSFGVVPCGTGRFLLGTAVSWADPEASGTDLIFGIWADSACLRMLNKSSCVEDGGFLPVVAVF